MKSAFSEVFTLAGMVADMCECTVPEAMDALSNLALRQRGPFVSRPRGNGDARPDTLPENVVRYVASCAPGAQLTALEIYGAVGLPMPHNSKLLSYHLKSQGWVSSNFKRDGARLYTRPLGNGAS